MTRRENYVGDELKAQKNHNEDAREQKNRQSLALPVNIILHYSFSTTTAVP